MVDGATRARPGRIHGTHAAAPTTHCEYVQPSARTSHTCCLLAVVFRLATSELCDSGGETMTSLTSAER
jgi:hypothetical protein